MYIELHAASAFSFLEGASVPEELAAVCAEYGMPGMAMADRDGLYGAPRFHMAMNKAGMRAHIGGEITFAPRRHTQDLVIGRSGDREIEKPAKITGSPDHPIPRLHRRDALWQVASASRGEGPLLRGVPELDTASPLQAMDREERLVADFRGTGVTVGPHPMAYRRAELKAQGVRSAAELEKVPNGQWVRAAGCVIARQRPGTARGFMFLSLEDETGIANAIVTPDLFEQNRLLLVGKKFLLIEGVLQNLDNVISVKAERVLPLSVTEAETRSHDFH